MIFNILGASKYIVCSGVFLKGSAFAMGVWNPSKGLHAIMAVILLLLDIRYVVADSVYYTFICHMFETPLNSWFCGNKSSKNSSSASLQNVLHGIDTLSILSREDNNIGWNDYLVIFFFCVFKYFCCSKGCKLKLNFSQHCETQCETCNTESLDDWIMKFYSSDWLSHHALQIQ